MAEDLRGGRIVISAQAQPREGHAWVCNRQQNLQELSIVTNEQPYDLAVHPRGGSMLYISHLNPKAIPLHFILYKWNIWMESVSSAF